MKNYWILDIFQTLQRLPKFKSPFLPNLPSSILCWQHHHSSHCESLCPSSRQKEDWASFTSTLFSLWAPQSNFSRFLVLNYLQLASELVLLLESKRKYLLCHCQILFFLENRLKHVISLFDNLPLFFPPLQE